MRLSRDLFAPRRLLVLAGLGIALTVADSTPAFEHARFALSMAIGFAALAFFLIDRLTRAQVNAIGVRLLLMLIALALAAVGAEYTTRWVFRDVTTSTDNASFFTRRWLRSGARRLNAQGYRGEPFTEAKPPGVYRVAVVGDSFTFGNGIRQEDRYTDLLRARLPATIEVLNFGEGGANTPQHEKRVAELLQTVDPDFILLQWYVNDMEGDDVRGRPAARPLIPSLHEYLGARSALYNVANIKWAEFQARRGWTRSYVEFMNERLRDPLSRHAQADSHLLQALIDHATNAGVPIGMVLFPDMAAPLDEAYPFGYLHDRVLEICRVNKLTCVDLRQDFAMVKDYRQLWASRFDHHASALANAIAAEKILTTFATKWASSPAR